MSFDKSITPHFNAVRQRTWKDHKVGVRRNSDGTNNYWQGGHLVKSEKSSTFLDAAKQLLHKHREDPRLSTLRINPQPIVERTLKGWS